jgi:hypothetical protein
MAWPKSKFNFSPITQSSNNWNESKSTSKNCNLVPRWAKGWLEWEEWLGNDRIWFYKVMFVGFFIRKRVKDGDQLWLLYLDVTKIVTIRWKLFKRNLNDKKPHTLI